MSQKLYFINSARFIATSFSNLVNDLTKGIHTIKGKYEHGDKKYETCVIQFKYCNCCLEYTNFIDDVIEYKCICCNKNYQKSLIKT